MGNTKGHTVHLWREVGSRRGVQNAENVMQCDRCGIRRTFVAVIEYRILQGQVEALRTVAAGLEQQLQEAKRDMVRPARPAHPVVLGELLTGHYHYLSVLSCAGCCVAGDGSRVHADGIDLPEVWQADRDRDGVQVGGTKGAQGSARDQAEPA